MTKKEFESYLTSNNCTVSGKGGSYTATRNDNPSLTASYETSGPKVSDNYVRTVCTTLELVSPV